MSEYGKIETRITPNADTFYAVHITVFRGGRISFRGVSRTTAKSKIEFLVTKALRFCGSPRYVTVFVIIVNDTL